jgi:hypothetical protein
MTRSRCSNCGSARRSGFLLALWLALSSFPSAQSAAPGAASPAQTPSGPDTLLAQATRAETELRLDAARARLYQLLIEQPGTADAHNARLRLARLLALSKSAGEALAQCQLLRDELARDHPLQQEALDIASVLARRLRAAQNPAAPYFASGDGAAARGIQRLDEPRAIVFEQNDRWVLLDEGAKRVYRVAGDAATSLATPKDPSAVAVLPGGVVAIAGSTGLATTASPGPVPLAGTWKGRARQAKEVRSMAVLSDGSLLVLDKDFEGVLRCQPATGACAPWGPVGKFQVVRVGPSDWVYLLDDKGESVRVLDGAQRLITAFGPLVGAVKLEEVRDMAVDALHGIYLVDAKTKRFYVFHLAAGPDGKLSAALAGSALLPQEGDREMKNPSAIGVSPDGSVLVAGRSSSRIERYR